MRAVSLLRSVQQRAMTRPHDERFYTWAGPRPVVEVGGLRLVSPAYYHRCEGFQSVHLAAYDAVAGTLPTGELHAVRWFDGRAAVVVAAMRYHEVSGVAADGTVEFIAPYGEVMVGALVTRRPVPRGWPVVAPAAGGVGAFVLDLPVTTAEARDLGLSIYGLPKFVADLAFVDDTTAKQVVVSEGERRVLTLGVRARGRVTTDRDPMIMYSTVHGELVETTARVLGHRQAAFGRRSGRLSLGDHPVADRLRSLEVSLDPLLTTSYLDLRMILPFGTPIATAHDHAGHRGRSIERGRYTVEFPGTGPIDQYAGAPTTLSARV